jgi:simple sugar transport system substrate-binding protein
MKKLFVSFGMLISLTVYVGCGGREESELAPGPASKPAAKALTVGFSQIGAESAWRTAETQSIRSEAEKRGVNLKFSDAQQKQENQIKALKAFVAQGVDAIILAPVVETGWEPVLLEIRQAKIPVILVDRGVSVEDDSLYTTLIASDFVEEDAWRAIGWRETGWKRERGRTEGNARRGPRHRP